MFVCKTYFDLWIQVFWRFLFLNCRHIDSYRLHKTCSFWKSLIAKSPTSPKANSCSSWCCKPPWRATIPLGDVFTSSSGFSILFLLLLPQTPKGKFAQVCWCRQSSTCAGWPHWVYTCEMVSRRVCVPMLGQEGVGGGTGGLAKSSADVWSRATLDVTPIE